MTVPDSIQAAAAWYAARGWHLVLLGHHDKKPVVSGWQKTPEPVESFTNGNNLGGHVAKSGYAEVDLDCAQAVRLAPHFLPGTHLIHGRAGRPRSHWWYHVDAVVETYRYKDIDGSVLLELRGEGVQTMLPPSIHPSGEGLVWHEQGEPGDVDHRVLCVYTGRLASACLLVRYWPIGSRHELALALAGALLRNGWDVDSAAEFVELVAATAGDSDPDKSGTAVRDTAVALGLGRPTTGIPTVRRILGERITDQLTAWLGLNHVTEDVAPEIPDNPNRVHIPYVMTLGEFSVLELPPTRWLIEGFLRAVNANATVAPPKAYKSFLEMLMHIAIASGGLLFDRFDTGEPQHTLYVQDEQSAPDFQARWARLIKGMGINTRDVFKYLHIVTNQQVRLDDPLKAAQLVTEAVERFNPVLISFDTFRNTHGKQENDSTEMTPILQTILELRDKWSATVSIVHHAVKNPVNEDPAAAMRGSGHIWSQMDSGIFVTKEIENGVKYGRVSLDGRGGSWAEPFKYTVQDTPDGGVRVVYIPLERSEQRQHEDADYQDRVAQYVGERAGQDGVTVNDILEANLFGSPDSLRKALASLTEHQRLIWKNGKHGQRFYWPHGAPTF